MTRFVAIELPVLVEVWRADADGEQLDWQRAADAAGIDRNRVPHVLWQLHEAGYIATDLERPTGGYVPFPMAARVTAKGRAGIGEGPDGADAAFAVLQRQVEAHAAAGADQSVVAEAEAELGTTPTRHH